MMEPTAERQQLKNELTTLKQHIKTKQHERTALLDQAQHLTDKAQHLTDTIQSLSKQYGLRDRALAKLDGRHNTVRPTKPPRHPRTPEQRAQRHPKGDQGASPKNSRHNSSPPTPEDLLALINKIPEERRRAFIERIFSKHHSKHHSSNTTIAQAPTT